MGEPTIVQEDLNVLTRWVKTNLFEKVKFLYNPDRELQVNGVLYNLFLNDCKGILRGLKTPMATGGEYWRLYVGLLWQEASNKKRNIIANGLTIRRTSVYAAMQNRFVGKSNNEIVRPFFAALTTTWVFKQTCVICVHRMRLFCHASRLLRWDWKCQMFTSCSMNTFSNQVWAMYDGNGHVWRRTTRMTY